MNTELIELWVYGICALALILFNALFVASEFALVKLRFTRFGPEKWDEAKQEKRLANLLEDMGKSVKLLRLGVVTCTIGLAFAIMPLISSLVGSIEVLSSIQEVLAVGLGVVFAIGVHYVLGESIPRAVALEHPVATLKWTSAIIVLFGKLSYLFLGVVDWTAGRILVLLRLSNHSDLNLLDADAQIRGLENDGEELNTVTENIMNNAMDLGKRVAHDIMIPRNQLVYIDTEDTVEQNLEIMLSSGHTRFPLCSADLDHCVGLVHIKDIFRNQVEGREVDFEVLKRPVFNFDSDESLERVLQLLLKNKAHFALLKDEFGGTIGAVALEDILEEVVGDIQDEFDQDEELVSQVEEGLFVVDGLTPLHDLSESIGLEIEGADVSTVGGYITSELGRMPVKNMPFQLGRLSIEVTDMDERRIIAATIRVLDEEEDDEEISDLD